MYNNAQIIIIISMLWNGEVNSVLCVFPDPEASCWKEEKRSNKPKSGWTEEFAAETYVRSSESCLKKNMDTICVKLPQTDHNLWMFKPTASAES